MRGFFHSLHNVFYQVTAMFKNLFPIALLLMGSGLIAQNSVIIDHTNLHLFDSIPAEYLAKARETKMYWMNRSVGGNISQGLDCFAAADFFGSTVNNGGYLHPAYCRRYYSDPLDVGFQKATTLFTHQNYLDGNVPAPILHHPSRETFDRSNWVYEFWGDDPSSGSTGQWFEKVNYFITRGEKILAADPDVEVLSFQFSYLEVDGNANIPIEDPTHGYFSGNIIRPGYLDVEAFDAGHPDVTVIHWTTSMALTIGTVEAQIFNDQMRDFAQQNNKFLIDAAAILSHDPDGNPCFGITPATADYPAICPHYTTEQYGGHLGAVSAGMIRMAKAMWIMMAQVAGWQPEAEEDPYLSVVSPAHQWFLDVGTWGINKSVRQRFSTDTVEIGGISYHTLQESAEETGESWYDLGLYRESGGKVWRLNDQMEEDIVYDFTLGVGDTFIRNSDFHQAVLVVTEIDTIVFQDGITRKRLWLKCADNFVEYYQWVEGVGGLDVDVLYYHNVCVVDLGGLLYCFYSDGQQLFKQSGVPDCFLKTATHTERKVFPDLFPNPTDARIYIRNGESIERYEIRDLLGNLVMSGNFTNPEIDVSKIQSGSYLVFLFDVEANRRCQRIVVSR